MLTEQDKKTLQIGIAFGLIVALFVLYYYIIMVRAEIQKEAKAQDALNKEVAVVDKELKEIYQLKSQRPEVEKWRQTIEEASRLLPSTPQAEDFFRNLYEILTKSNVLNHAIKPAKIEERSIYTEIPWQIRCTGQYFEFGPFVNMVELNPNRFMRVKTFTIKNDDKLPGYHPVDIQIATFMFK